MRLSDILSKEPMKEFIAVDNFAPKNSAQIGKVIKLKLEKFFLIRSAIIVIRFINSIRMKYYTLCLLTPTY